MSNREDRMRAAGYGEDFVMPSAEFTEAPAPLPGLGLPNLTDRQLLDLAETLDNVHIRWCIRVLAHNRTSPEVRAACRRDLRAALGISAPTAGVAPFKGPIDEFDATAVHWVSGNEAGTTCCGLVKGRDRSFVYRPEFVTCPKCLAALGFKP